MYKSLPWEGDITRADALGRAGTSEGILLFLIKKRERGGKSDIWSLAEAMRVGLDALFVHRIMPGEKTKGRR